MRRKPGERAIPIKLPAIDGSIYDTDRLNGMSFMEKMKETIYHLSK